MIELYNQAIYTSPMVRNQVMRHMQGNTISGLHESDEKNLEMINEVVDYLFEELEDSIAGSPFNFRNYYNLGPVATRKRLHSLPVATR